MSGENLVPVEHLLHLLRKHKNGKQFGTKEMLKLAQTGTVDARADIIDVLDKAFPGTRARLDRTWRWHGTTAVHLWHLPVITQLTASNIRSLVKNNVGANLGVRGLHEVEGKLTKGGDARIAGVELADDILLVTVRKSGVTTWHYEDEDEEAVFTRDIEVALDLNRKIPILEVYATLQDARMAASEFVTSVLGEVLPEPGPKRDKIIKPIIFTQSMVTSITKRLGTGGESGIAGPDAQGEHGEVRYYGKPEGTVLLPLVNSKRAQSQTATTVKNHFREFLLTHTHDDGYVHKSNVQFYFKSGQHPHLRFKNKTSRPAVHRVVDEVCDEATT
jgi:hypothetical protein